MRTDKNNNPAAFTVDIAREAGLVLGTDYVAGDPFQVGDKTYYTARLLGDPIAITIRVIDKIGFFVGGSPRPRWIYVAIPYFLWLRLDTRTKTEVIRWMYHNEGGTEMEPLFVKALA